MHSSESSTKKAAGPQRHRYGVTKKAIQRRLLTRLALAGTAIAVILGTAVFFNERSKLGQIVIDRASRLATRFNEQIVGLLDAPGPPDREALQRELDILFIAGNLDQWIGHLVCVSIYDEAGQKIVGAVDDTYPHIKAVDTVLAAGHHSRLDATNSWYELKRIEGALHVHVAVPLTNSRAEIVARAEGMVAVSPNAAREIQNRIIRTVVEVILIVFTVTALLYPIILTLVGRLGRMTDSLLESNLETLRVLGSAIAKRDSDTDIHNYRVTIYAVRLAEAVGADRQAIRALIKGAFLHDVGKIGISDRILLKPAELTAVEFEVMKNHVKHGVDIVERSDWLRDATEVVGYHHEQYAGRGYPTGIAGRRIPFTARIFAVADVFDALTSERPYKKPYDFDTAVDILKAKRGRHLDPLLVDAFVAIARSLYDDLANGEPDKPRRRLEQILLYYFSTEMGTLLPARNRTVR